jgi:predicted secreted protein
MTVLKGFAGFSLMLVAVIQAAGCGSKTSHAGQAAEAAAGGVVVTEKDSGRTLRLKIGDVLTVKLESIPGTGYSWYVQKHDSKLMEQIGKHTHETPKGSSGVGGPEYEIFRFRAAAAGEDRLTLCYQRIWERGKEPLRKVWFRVTVQP